MPLPASLTNSVLTHEFGHVLGLMHANSLQCGSGAQDVRHEHGRDLRRFQLLHPRIR